MVKKLKILFLFVIIYMRNFELHKHPQVALRKTTAMEHRSECSRITFEGCIQNARVSIEMQI